MLIGEINWTNVSGNWIQFAMSGYTNIFENFTYPLIFLGIIGYIYCITKSAIGAAIGICIVFVIYGGSAVFNYPESSLFSFLGWIIVIVSFAGLFTALFVRANR